MKYQEVLTIKKYCNTCKTETEFFKGDNVCCECLMITITKKKVVGKQKELF